MHLNLKRPAACVAVAVLWLAVRPAQAGEPKKPDGAPLPEGAVAQLDGGLVQILGAPPSLAFNSVAFSPDGKHALIGNDDKTLALWDIATGKKVRVFEGHTNAVYSAVFSADGKQALSSSEDKTLALWDVATGKRVREFEGNTKSVHSAVLSPDGKLALSGSGDNTLALWDVATGQKVRTFEGHTMPAWSVAFSPEGRQALSGGFDQTIILWDTATGKKLRVFEGHADTVFSVAFSPEGKQALSGSWDKTLALWDVATGKKIRAFEGHAGPVTSVAFSPDGKQALSGSFDNSVIIWDVETGQKVREFKGHTAGVLSARFSSGGRYLISCGRDATALVWHPGLKQAEAAKAWITDLRGKPEGDRAAALAVEAGRLADQKWETRLEASERLFAAGDEAAAALLAKYPPEPANDAKDRETFAALLKRLDDEEYKVRVKAQEELGEIMPRVRALAEEKSKDAAISLEVRSSLKNALTQPATLEMGNPGRVCAVLALMEMPGSAVARAALAKYAEGPMSSCAASLARHAKAAVQ
jgi:WD40 repeat protein